MSPGMPEDWMFFTNPGAGAQAIITIPAGGPGVSRVLKRIDALIMAAASNTQTGPTITVLDGATLVFEWLLALTNTAPAITSSEMSKEVTIVGTPATAMTVQFSSGVAFCYERLLISGYDL